MAIDPIYLSIDSIDCKSLANTEHKHINMTVDLIQARLDPVATRKKQRPSLARQRRPFVVGGGCCCSIRIYSIQSPLSFPE
jgi:arginase family enzyme